MTTPTLKYESPRAQKLGMKNLITQRAAGQRPDFQAAVQQVVRHDYAVADSPGMIYSCGLFDLCGDRDLMSLVYGQDPAFIEWLTWQLSRNKIRHKYYITWIAPEGTAAGAPTSGAVEDCCEPGAGVEWGICDYMLKGFGKLRRTSPTRCLTDYDMKLCESQPIYTLDGVPIADDYMWDKLMAMRGIYQDLFRMVINGDGSQPGQFDGIQNLIKSGFTNSDGEACTSMDSICVDWAGGAIDGSEGGPATWNGEECEPGLHLMDVLEDVFRTILDRIRLSSTLSTQRLDTNSGDIILMGHSKCLRCLIDAFTCWRVCAGGEYNITNLNSYEARNFRTSLQGGLFGAGTIEFDGQRIHLMPHDYGTLDPDDPTNCTFYMLTGSVGNIPVLFGELYDMRGAASKSATHEYTDGGRVLAWSSNDETCFRSSVEMMPRLVNEAPFLQAKIENVPCKRASKAGVSADPLDDCFPEQNKVVAACDDDGEKKAAEAKA